MTAPVGREHPARGAMTAHRQISSLARRPAPPSAAGGNAIYAIEVFEVDTPIVAGDDQFEWMIPLHLDGAELIEIESYVTTVSSSGTVQVQIANERYGGGTVDMLSTVLSIDVGELNSADATTPVVINAANAIVAHKDHLRIDVDGAGTGATGLGLILTFLPNDAFALIVQGATGPAGGVTSWQGAWSSVTAYTTGQSVSNNGTSYVARTGSTNVEPGVTAGWETYWQVLAEREQFFALEYVMNGNGYTPELGPKDAVYVPFDCTIREVTMLADRVGSAVVDIWKDTYANYPPTNADSITSASPPTITTATTGRDSVLSGWTTALAPEDVLLFNLDSITTITRLTIILKVERI